MNVKDQFIKKKMDNGVRIVFNSLFSNKTYSQN